MPTVDVFSKAGAKVGTVELPAAFSSPVNEALIHQAVVSQLAGRRTGTHASKKRGAVAGGGRKPWKQKGTGRARQGSTRSPQWKGGGVVFGPQVRSHEIPFPKRMRRAALLGALAAKVETLKIIDVTNNFNLSMIPNSSKGDPLFPPPGLHPRPTRLFFSSLGLEYHPFL
jgi:large subunit ribosomal protein L4